MSGEDSGEENPGDSERNTADVDFAEGEANSDNYRNNYHSLNGGVFEENRL